MVVRAAGCVINGGGSIGIRTPARSVYACKGIIDTVDATSRTHAHTVDDCMAVSIDTD
jgi:hypothetical protein